jgi:hypothetical protein
MGTTKTKPWLLFVLLLILSCNTLSAGQSLSFSKNEIILSQGGTFELGFFTPGSSVKIYLGIWYKWFVPKEVVWVANRQGCPASLGELGGCLRLPIKNINNFFLYKKKKGL